MVSVMVLGVGSVTSLRAVGENETTQVTPAVAAPETNGKTQPRFFISEYRVKGAKQLKRLEIEAAVYPYLGPERTENDVKAACAALEKVYREKGYSAVSVLYDSQIGKGGIVTLQVSEGTVARLRVKGARYFSPADVKAAAPSLKEGSAINFNDVNKDILALNQLPDRRVLPALKQGAEPGTFDIDLEVKDKSPVHASVEVNNQHIYNTTPLRTSVSVSDNNLAQTGDTLGLSYQVAPKRRDDTEVFSAFFLARFASLKNTTFLLQGNKRNSSIATLDGASVATPGETVELHTNITLPNGKDWSTGKDWTDFFHSISFGIAYKHDKQTLTTPGATEGASSIVTPIAYFPFSIEYTATCLNLIGKNSTTEFDAGVNFHFRGVGSGPSKFAENRYGSDGGYLYFRADLSHTQDIFQGMQVFGKVSGQLSNQPLISDEQLSIGGLATVRGYYEAQAVGDNGISSTLELRSPSIWGAFKKPVPTKAESNPAGGKEAAKPSEEEKRGEWRFHVFGDAGGVVLQDALPGQKWRFGMVSVGAGTRISWSDMFSASLDAGYPIYTLGHTKAQDWRLTFRASLSY